MPAAHQRSAICPSRQRLTLAEWARQMEIMLSMALVERSVRASVGGTPSRSTVRVSQRCADCLMGTAEGMRAYSMDLRERVVAAVDRGITQEQAAVTCAGSGNTGG